MENDGIYINYEEAKPHLICRLVTPKDEALLKKVPFGRAFEDILAVPCIFSRKEDGKAAGRPVTLFQLAQWGIDPQRILQDAVHNMQIVLPPRLNPMNRLMESPMKGSLRQLILSALTKKFLKKPEEELDRLAGALAKRMGQRLQEEGGLEPMWVLGNDAWLFGATSLLFPGVLDGVAQKLDRNLYILPSSIHEVILLPEGGAETRELLYGMVKNGNARLSPPRFLSDSVYRYDRNKMEIKTL